MSLFMAYHCLFHVNGYNMLGFMTGCFYGMSFFMTCNCLYIICRLFNDFGSVNITRHRPWHVGSDIFFLKVCHGLQHVMVYGMNILYIVNIEF